MIARFLAFEMFSPLLSTSPHPAAPPLCPSPGSAGETNYRPLTPQGSAGGLLSATRTGVLPQAKPSGGDVPGARSRSAVSTPQGQAVPVARGRVATTCRGHVGATLGVSAVPTTRTTKWAACHPCLSCSVIFALFCVQNGKNRRGPLGHKGLPPDMGRVFGLFCVDNVDIMSARP